MAKPHPKSDASEWARRDSGRRQIARPIWREPRSDAHPKVGESLAGQLHGTTPAAARREVVVQRAQHEAGEGQCERGRFAEARERREEASGHAARAQGCVLQQLVGAVGQRALAPRGKEEEAPIRVDAVSQVVLQEVGRVELALPDGDQEPEEAEDRMGPVAVLARFRVRSRATQEEREVVEPRQRAHPLALAAGRALRRAEGCGACRQRRRR